MAVNPSPREHNPGCLVNGCSNVATASILVVSGPGYGLAGQGCPMHVRRVAGSLPPASTIVLTLNPRVPVSLVKVG